ncbi:MAG: WG repeat-containing protein [Kiritimatiellae bacterium]|nr:WG repeat-containing protein [Kiritimatiellia bacterium]
MRLGKSRQLILVVTAVLCLDIRAGNALFFPTKLGNHPWDIRIGIATTTGLLRLPLEFQKIIRLSENMFWCSTPESIMTKQGDTQLITKLVSTNGVPIFDEIFAQYVENFPLTPPVKVTKDVFYAHLIRDREPVPVLIFEESGVLQEIALTSYLDLGNAHLTYIRSGQGYRVYSIDTRQTLGPVYEEIRLGFENVFVRNGDKWRLMKEENGTLRDVTSMEFDNVKRYKYFVKLWLIEKNGKQGLVTEDGIWKIPLQDDFKIIGPSFTQQDAFDKFIIVSANGKKNLFDMEDNRLVFKKGFQDISEASSQFAACSIHPKEYFLVDVGRKKRIKEIPPCKSLNRPLASADISSLFWEAETNDGRVIYWVNDGKVKSFNGVWLDTLVFDMRKMVIVHDNHTDKEGVVNVQTGEMIVGLERNREVESWSDKVKVTDNGREISIVDSQGKSLMGKEAHISLLDNPDSSSYARIVCDGKSGLIDSECRFVLPCQYEDVGHFGEGLVPAKEGGKWGFVELSGKWAIPPRFENARSFRNGFAPVCIGGKWGFIGNDGKPKTPVAYEDVKDVREDHFRAQVNGKWGIFALDGTCTLPAEYDKIIASDEPEYGDPR